MKKIMIIQMGRMDYGEALKLQKRLAGLRRAGRIGDLMLLLEHPPVLTLGERGEDSNILVGSELLLGKGIQIHRVDRGGDVTYHGPGQIVGYPIMDLRDHDRDVHRFIYSMKDAFVRLLKVEYGIDAVSEDKKYTGVWVDRRKITAIGIAVRQWITTHGFAFNVNTDLRHFQWILPCGLRDRGVTSLTELLGRDQDMERVECEVADYFCRALEVEPIAANLKQLLIEAEEWVG